MSTLGSGIDNFGLAHQSDEVCSVTSTLSPARTCRSLASFKMAAGRTRQVLRVSDPQFEIRKGKKRAHLARIIVQRLCPLPGFLLLFRLWLHVLFRLGRRRSWSCGGATHGRRQQACGFLRRKRRRRVHRRRWCVLRRCRPAQ